jgi:hypothetical protein
MKKGTVFLHKDYYFADGGVADKYFIILNDPMGTEPFLTCKTTSRQNSRPDKIGCHFAQNIYVIGDKEDFFPKKTWVQFYILYPVSPKRLTFLVNAGDVTKEAELRTQTINAIVNCVKYSEDISYYHLEMLKR